MRNGWPSGWYLIHGLLAQGPTNRTAGAEGGELVRLLREARRVLIFTGAGVSEPSGLPNEDGYQEPWGGEKPIGNGEFLSSASARERYWRWKLAHWEQFREALPNPVHWAIVELERAGKLEMVVTHNIDGLHTWAGTSQDHLVELHGRNTELRCLDCAERHSPGPFYERLAAGGEIPCCPCGGWLKPGTLAVDESLDAEDLQRAAAAAAGADLVIALGSTLGVYPASALPLLAAQQGASYVLINDGPTAHDDHPLVHLRLAGDLLEIFPAAVAASNQAEVAQG